MTLILAGVYARQSVVTPLKRDCVYRLNFTCLIRRASSTGRCNTIQWIESTMLGRENHLFSCARLKSSQGGVPTGLTLISDLGICFQGQGVLAYRCVDPLRSPDLSGVGGQFAKLKPPQ